MPQNRHTTEMGENVNMQSVLERNDLAELMAMVGGRMGRGAGAKGEGPRCWGSFEDEVVQVFSCMRGTA